MSRPRFLAVAGLKGGIGRSTVTLNLGAALAEAGRRVVLIDCDPQGSLAAIQAEDNPGDAEELGRPPIVGIGRDLEAAGDPLAVLRETIAGTGAELVVADGPPFLSGTVRAMLAAADVALCPITPSAFDLRALWSVLRLIDEGRAQGITPAVRVLVNRSQPRSLLGREVAEVLRARNVTVCRARLGSRAAFAATATAGEPVTHAAPSSRAAEEVRALATELETILFGAPPDGE